MSDSKLYIGNLSSRTDERYLKDAFSKYGRIVTVEMKRRYAFVDFQRKSDAEAAISSMDGKEFDGSKLIVEWTRGQARTGRARGARRYPERSDYRIEVANLPDRCHWSELKDHFRKAGEVVFGDVWGSKGVIEFKHKNDMDYALKELDGVRWKGYALELRRDRRSSSRDRSGSRDRRRSSRRSYRSYSPDSRSRSRERERERDRDRDSRRRSRGSRSPSRSRSPRNKTQRSPSKSRSHSPRSPSKEKRRDSKDKKKYDSRSPSPKKTEQRSPRDKDSSANVDSEKREKDREEEDKEKKEDTARPEESPRESRKRENEENDNERDDRKRQRTD